MNEDERGHKAGERHRERHGRRRVMGRHARIGEHRADDRRAQREIATIRDKSRLNELGGK